MIAHNDVITAHVTFPCWRLHLQTQHLGRVLGWSRKLKTRASIARCMMSVITNSVPYSTRPSIVNTCWREWCHTRLWRQPWHGQAGPLRSRQWSSLMTISWAKSWWRKGAPRDGTWPACLADNRKLETTGTPARSPGPRHVRWVLLGRTLYGKYGTMRSNEKCRNAR
jgi:hypothetical protein